MDVVDELEIRMDKPYDEETVSTIRFPGDSICRIPHAPATDWGQLSGVVAVEAYKLHLLVPKGIPAE